MRMFTFSIFQEKTTFMIFLGWCKVFQGVTVKNQSILCIQLRRKLGLVTSSRFKYNDAYY